MLGAMSARRDHAIAAAWGFAEATVFFIVPDVWTSRVALRHPRRALATCASAVAGAMVGGAVVHTIASRTPASDTARWLARIPAISDAMVARVDSEVSERGFLAVLVGPTKGVPYKIYARSVGVQGLSLPRLMAWTIPARAIRFLLVTGATGALASGAQRLGISTPTTEKATHALGWAAFYAWYFREMGTR